MADTTLERGQLRHRVSLQRHEQAQDAGTGILMAAWVDVAQVWAAIEPLSAREFVASQAVQSAVTARITIEFRDGVTAGMRVVHENRLYDIQGVLRDRRSGREYLTLPVSEGVGDGQ